MNIRDHHPAFWAGMLMLGCSGLALDWGLGVVIWIVLLLIPHKKSTASQNNLQNRRTLIPKALFLSVICSAALGTCCFFYTSLNAPSKWTTTERGVGYFKISEVKEVDGPFGKHIAYIGKILRFEGERGGIVLRNLPCRIYPKKSYGLPNADFLVKGLLVPNQYGKYQFKTEGPWQKIEGSFSLAHFRYQLKKQAKHYLKQHFHNPKVLSLFSALVLGDIDDRQLASNFKQIGLSHLLAISGFHFTLVAGLSSWLFLFFLPRKIQIALVFLLISAYAVFLGNSPSILRAWVSISLFLFAKFFGYRTTALNALGCGLIVELLIDPCLINQFGFGLSFLATTAILLLYRPCERWLRCLFLSRTTAEVEELSFLEKHLYLVSSCLRKALAVNCSVHLVLY